MKAYRLKRSDPTATMIVLGMQTTLCEGTIILVEDDQAFLFAEVDESWVEVRDGTPISIPASRTMPA